MGHLYPASFSSVRLQPVPEKMRLEMVIGIQTKILDGHPRSLFERKHLKRDMSFNHRGFQFAFRRAFRVSSSRERVAVFSWMTVISSCSRSSHRFRKKFQRLLAIVHPLCGSMHVVRPSVVLTLVLPRRTTQSNDFARILTYFSF